MLFKHLSLWVKCYRVRGHLCDPFEYTITTSMTFTDLGLFFAQHLAYFSSKLRGKSPTVPSLSCLGPLVCEKDNRWYLVGTTSWGWGCAGQYYGVYTNIARLFYWIKANML